MPHIAKDRRHIVFRHRLPHRLAEALAAKDGIAIVRILRIRIGVAPERKVADGAAYLLAPMKKKDLEVVDGMLDTAAEAVKMILRDGPAAAMNRFNRKELDEQKD